MSRYETDTRTDPGPRSYATAAPGPTFYCNHCQSKDREVYGRRSRFLAGWGMQPACASCVRRIDERKAA